MLIATGSAREKFSLSPQSGNINRNCKSHPVTAAVPDFNLELKKIDETKSEEPGYRNRVRPTSKFRALIKIHIVAFYPCAYYSGRKHGVKI